MTDDLDELRQRAARLTAVLESNWNEEFVEELSGEEEAAAGFALARAWIQGWIEPSADLSGVFDAAEAFSEGIEEADDDLD